MGCLNGNADQLLLLNNVCISLEGKLSGKADNKNVLQYAAARCFEQLKGKATRKGQLHAKCSIVCENAFQLYLRLNPEIVWLVPQNDNYAEIDVYSNVTWIVE